MKQNFNLKHLHKHIKGGVSVKGHKNTKEACFIKMKAPDRVTLLTAQHIGVPAKIVVKNGQTVKRGELVATASSYVSSDIYSPISGKVSVSETTNLSGIVTPSVIVENDHQNLCEQFEKPTVFDHKSFIDAVKKSSLVGLGGAGFPSFIKLSPKDLSSVNTLIVNGAECEPFITADYRTMIEFTDDLIFAIKTVIDCLDISNTIIGIEKNKPLAIKKLTTALKDSPNINIQPLRTIYPQGAEKVLIYETCGKVVKEGELPCDVGCVVMNVASLVFLANFLKTGAPLMDRFITVDGGGVRVAQNIIAPIGSSVSDILEFCGGEKEEISKILLGGPMMGNCVADISYPISKTTNAVLFMSKNDLPEINQTPCIRCGKCVTACPMNLMPLEFEKAYLHKDVDRLKKLKVNLCMQCGCCSFSCPAKRDLVHSIILGKELIK